MKLTRTLGAFGAIAVLAAAGIACNSSDNGGSVNTPPPTSTSSTSPATCTTPSPEAPVTINATDNLKFEPSSVTVKPCQLLVWKVTGVAPHTITAKSGATFDSGILQQGGTFTQGLPTAGTIHYYCKIHPTMMGTITVKP
jgi:plastocyanin